MGDKRVHVFPKGICLKVNIIERVEFELTYCHSADQRFNHYATRKSDEMRKMSLSGLTKTLTTGLIIFRLYSFIYSFMYLFII